jgi:hypothetical protein
MNEWKFNFVALNAQMERFVILAFGLRACVGRGVSLCSLQCVFTRRDKLFFWFAPRNHVLHTENIALSRLKYKALIIKSKCLCHFHLCTEQFSVYSIQMLLIAVYIKFQGSTHASWCYFEIIKRVKCIITF